MHYTESEMEILSSHNPRAIGIAQGVANRTNAAAILRRQSVQSNRKIPQFAILQSARNRTFLRVISNAISSRLWPEEGGQADGRGQRVGRRRVVGLPAIMRSSVFRCRSASPYRYVSSLPPVPSPRHPPDRPFGPAWRSNGFTDSRYPQYSIFISKSNFATAVAISPYFYDSLSFSRRDAEDSLPLSENSSENWMAIRSRYTPL